MSLLARFALSTVRAATTQFCALNGVRSANLSDPKVIAWVESYAAGEHDAYEGEDPCSERAIEARNDYLAWLRTDPREEALERELEADWDEQSALALARQARRDAFAR